MAQVTCQHLPPELDASITKAEANKNKDRIRDQLLEKTKENKRASSELVVLHATSAYHDDNSFSS